MATSNNTRQKILIVDDDALFLKSTQRIFLLQGDYETHTAANAEQALKVLATAKPQVVITDYMMPEIDGLMFIKKARQQWPDTVFIMITGNPSLTMTLDALNSSGVFRFLVKPFDDEELLKAAADGMKQHEYNVKTKSCIDRPQEPLLQEIIARAAHELKNQLLIVGLTAEKAMLKINADGPINMDDIIKDLKRVRCSAENMSGIIDGLNKTAAVDEKMPVTVDELLTDTVDFVGLIRLFSDIKFTWCIAENLPPVLINKSRIQQVLVNLFINAAETGQVQTISIEASRDGRQNGIALVVSDDGPGIPSQHTEKIFEPRFSTKGRGTGLGLSISRQLAENNGGALTLLRTEKRGASFQLFLPAAQEGSRPATAIL